jgi:hypothetical protein
VSQHGVLGISGFRVTLKLDRLSLVDQGELGLPIEVLVSPKTLSSLVYIHYLCRRKECKINMKQTLNHVLRRLIVYSNLGQLWKIQYNY